MVLRELAAGLLTVRTCRLRSCVSNHIHNQHERFEGTVAARGKCSTQGEGALEFPILRGSEREGRREGEGGRDLNGKIRHLLTY
jgi:hypothetical protein